MKTFRVFLTGENDSVLYGIKEFTAADEAQAAHVADELCDAWWGDQRLIKRLEDDHGPLWTPFSPGTGVRTLQA